MCYPIRFLDINNSKKKKKKKKKLNKTKYFSKLDFVWNFIAFLSRMND